MEKQKKAEEGEEGDGERGKKKRKKEKKKKERREKEEREKKKTGKEKKANVRDCPRGLLMIGFSRLPQLCIWPWDQVIYLSIGCLGLYIRRVLYQLV